MSYFTLLFELTSAGCWVPCNTPWLDWQHSQCVTATYGWGLAFWVAQLYTPNTHFPSWSSSNPVGTPLMTRVADDKPKRREVGYRGLQPLRHAPGSVTGVCVTTSWFCFSHWALSRHLGIHQHRSSSHLKSCLIKNTRKKCCTHAERPYLDRLSMGEPFRTALSLMSESIAVSSACLKQWPFSRCQAEPAKFSKIMRMIKRS